MMTSDRCHPRAKTREKLRFIVYFYLKTFTKYDSIAIMDYIEYDIRKEQTQRVFHLLQQRFNLSIMRKDTVKVFAFMDFYEEIEI